MDKISATIFTSIKRSKAQFKNYPSRHAKYIFTNLIMLYPNILWYWKAYDKETTLWKSKLSSQDTRILKMLPKESQSSFPCMFLSFCVRLHFASPQKIPTNKFVVGSLAEWWEWWLKEMTSLRILVNLDKQKEIT